MNGKGLFLFLAARVTFSGCVLQSEYKGKLGEIESLQKSRSGLEEKLSAAEKELSDLRRKNAELETRKAALEEDNARIKTTLEEKKNELAKTVVDLKKQLADNGAKIKNTYDSLVGELQQEIKQGEIQITQLKDKLTVKIVEKALFDSGSVVSK